jgi:N-carbamoyl-L-amino-acid hydrolase
VIDHLVQALKLEMVAIAEATHTSIDILPQLNVAPSPAADHIQRTIAQASAALGLSTLAMPSRAGHDALEMGRFTDMGMIFVPSQGGVSHSEVEYTTPEACIQGTNVLLETLRQLDRYYSLDQSLQP